MIGLNKRLKLAEMERRKKNIAKLGEELHTEANLATLREKEFGLRKSIIKKKSIAASGSGSGFGAGLKTLGGKLQSFANSAAEMEKAANRRQGKRKSKDMFGGRSWL